MSKIKSSLKNKDGAALPMVLVVMLILTMLGTALYVLAWNSFRTVRYMNDEKRAYYFARAGIEFASYAYQVADSQAASTDDPNADIVKLITFAGTENAIVTTNKIYIIPSLASGTGKWEGLSFSATPSADAIGEVTVDIGTGIEYVDITDADGVTTKTPNKVKTFRATAKCYTNKLEVEDGTVLNESSIESINQMATAYLAMSETAKPLSFYDSRGILSTDSYTSSDTSVSVEDKQTKFLKISKTIDINGTDIKPSSNRRFFLFRLLEVLRKSIIKSIFQFFYGSSVKVDLYIKTAEGNMILSKPANSNLIRTRDNAHNYYIFATPEDLFLDRCGLSVVPTKGNYNSVGLYGDEIVIDGDIIMGVYYVKTSGFGSAINSIIQTIGNRYRLGTVMLGEGSNGLTTRYDPVPISKGGLMSSGVKVHANKVYFNGNVYVKIFNQGGATETYRIFNAGDMAYFYGGYTESGTVDGEETAAKGVDLLKYFLDAVIDGKGDFNFGSALAEKAKVINNLYYVGEASNAAYAADDPDFEDSTFKGDPTPYFNDETVLIRKIKVKYATNGEITVDDGYGSVLDLIQPSNLSSSSLKWGNPEGGSVFSPKDGNTY